MKAKKKPIEKLTPQDLGVDLTPILETLKVAEPPKRVGGAKVCTTSTPTTVCSLCSFKVESVDELVSKLKAAGFA